MKKIAALTLLTSSLASFSMADEFTDSLEDSQFTGNVTGYLGIKSLKEEDWAPTDSHTSFGINVDLGMADWPVLVTMGFINSQDDYSEHLGHESIKLEAETAEMRLGIKYLPETHSNFQPYISGGIAKIDASFTTKNTNSYYDQSTTIILDESAIGAWLGLGLNWYVFDHLTLGGEISYSIADVTFSIPTEASSYTGNKKLEKKLDAAAGGAHLGLTAGFHW